MRKTDKNHDGRLLSWQRGECFNALETIFFGHCYQCFRGYL